MIKTYDETLKTLNAIRHWLHNVGADDCAEQIDNVAKYFIEEKRKTPTEEEIIKEWEDEGFEIVSWTKERIEIYKQWIERINNCSHHTSAKIVIEKDFFYIVGKFSNKYTQLLTKTFKMLGWEV